MALVIEVYRPTAHFPHEERYGLTAQVRRATVSVPSNVAEGHQLGTMAYRRSIRIAIGSLAEAETQVELAAQLGFADEHVVTALLDKNVGARPHPAWVTPLVDAPNSRALVCTTYANP